MRCARCNSPNASSAGYCGRCGAALARPTGATVSLHHPGIAALLSFLYSGLGQIYNGQILKGVFFMLVQLVNVILMWVLIGYLLYGIVWIWGMYDAYSVAKRQQTGR